MQEEPRGKSLEGLVQELPPDLQKEVRDFAEFLLDRSRRRRPSPLRQGWAGSLREYRGQYTALDLQKRALEWRGD